MNALLLYNNQESKLNTNSAIIIFHVSNVIYHLYFLKSFAIKPVVEDSADGSEMAPH